VSVLQSAIETVKLHRPRVVIVDDEPRVLAALRRLFRREPFDLMATADPDEALAWMGDYTVDLLITDQRMPAMSGTDLVERAAERSPTTVTIILTAFPDGAVLERCMRQGVRRFLTKPWDDRTLVRSVRELLDVRQAGRDP
jgi:YesN/AraC family two-component response regulator